MPPAVAGRVGAGDGRTGAEARALLFDVGEYAPVADRITLFYARFPWAASSRGSSRAPSRRSPCRRSCSARVEEERPSATGLASERIGDGDVNTVACLENTETSAIGRALASLGLTASAQRPSREEMVKANRERTLRVAGNASSSPNDFRFTWQCRASAQRRPCDGRARPAGGGAARWPHPVPLAPRSARSSCDRAVSDATVDRIERMLRSWTASRHALRLRL